MINKTYVFAKDKEELAHYVNRCWKGLKDHTNYGLRTQRFAKAYQAYYGLAWSSDYGTTQVGEQGEFSAININELRRQIKGVVSMTTQNRVVFDCVTTSTDVQAQNNVIIGNSLLEQKFYVDKVESKCKEMLEQGLVFDSSYIFVGYKTDNEIVGVDGEGKPVYKGSLDVEVLNKLDVIVEPSLDSWDKHEYVLFRRQENRYNLAAKYTEVAEEILDLPLPNNLQRMKMATSPEESPFIWVYYTFHKPTKALPQGRMHVCLDDNIILFDDVNPYQCLPVVCYKPHTVYGSSEGHALSYDLMPVQEAMNTLDSSILTMAENFAIPNITAGANWKGQETSLSGGMKLITGNSDKDAPNGGFPQAMDMPKPDSIYMQLNMEYRERLVNLAGSNAAAQGQTQAQQSGTAIALAQSAAQTNNSSVESGYIIALEQIAALILRVCRLFLTKDEIISQAGMSLDFQASTFATASLDEIALVKVDVGNSLAKTISGRLEIATQLLNQGQVSALEYLSILQTGNLPKVIQTKTAASAQIQYQTQQLMSGQRPSASVLDNQVDYIRAFKSILDIPGMRENSKVLALVNECIEERLGLFLQLQTGNPILTDIVMDIPIGTTQQSMAGAPQQVEQGAVPSAPEQQSNPEISQSADAALQGGAEPVAASARQTADRKLASVGG